MKIRKGTKEDIDLLVRLRLDYLREDWGELNDEKKTLIAEQLVDYFRRHLPAGDFVAMLAEEEGKVLSAAFLVINERPANPAFITGKTGTLLNVLTYPEYRRRGIAMKVLTALIAEARKLGACQLELNATEQGKPLYERLGFAISHYTSMRLKL